MPAVFRISLLTSLALLIATPASAGPLLDAIKARRAERQQNHHQDGMEEDGSASRASLPAGTKLLRDLSYGADKAQKLDVYLPAKPVGGVIIVMVHGGAWKLGDKGADSVVDNKVARWVSRGVVFVSVNYRMLPAADPLIQADDVARALGYVQGKAPSWAADPSKIVLMGHSAGAHLVDLLAAAPDKAKAQGAKPWLGTVSLDSAALDVPAIMAAKHYGFYDDVFGTDPAYWQAASPLQQLNSQPVPLLLVCSSTRPDKPCRQTHRFADKANRLGGRAEVLEQAMSHKEINNDLGLAGPYTQAVENFLSSLDGGFKQALATP